MTREAVHIGRAMSPNVASRAGLDRDLNGLKGPSADDLRLGTTLAGHDQQGFPVSSQAIGRSASTKGHS